MEIKANVIQMDSSRIKKKSQETLSESPPAKESNSSKLQQKKENMAG